MERKKQKTCRRTVFRRFMVIFCSFVLIACSLLLIPRKSFEIPQKNFREVLATILSDFKPDSQEKRAGEITATGTHFWDSDFPQYAPHDFRKIPETGTENAKNGQFLEFSSGDILAKHIGGRATLPDGSTVAGGDARRWFDARVPFSLSERLKFYAATSLGLENSAAGTFSFAESFARENLSIGGGFGFSFNFAEGAELIFDYRHAQSIESNSIYDTTNAVGFSLRISF